MEGILSRNNIVELDEPKNLVAVKKNAFLICQYERQIPEAKKLFYLEKGYCF